MVDLSTGQSIPDSWSFRYVQIAPDVYALATAAVVQDPPQDLEFDEITGAQVTIPVVHHETHEGEMFQASYKSPDAVPIADDANFDILMHTGARYNHLVFSVASGGTSEAFLYEGPTVNVAGTPMAENCMKRAGGEVSVTTVTHTPTIGATGTELANVLIPGGSGPGQARTGSTIRDNTEWILIPNTYYLIRATNRAGNVQPMGTILQWYEEGHN